MKISNNSKNSYKYTDDKTFLTSPEYFSSMTTIDEFLRDIIVTNTTNIELIIARHTNFMKLFTCINKNDKKYDEKLYNIIRLVVVLANNINIQYTDIKKNEIEITPKIYKYLKFVLPLHIELINEIYNMYHLTNSFNKNSPNAMYINYINNIISLRKS